MRPNQAVRHAYRADANVRHTVRCAPPLTRPPSPTTHARPGPFLLRVRWASQSSPGYEFPTGTRSRPETYFPGARRSPGQVVFSARTHAFRGRRATTFLGVFNALNKKEIATLSTRGSVVLWRAKGTLALANSPGQINVAPMLPSPNSSRSSVTPVLPAAFCLLVPTRFWTEANRNSAGATSNGRAFSPAARAPRQNGVGGSKVPRQPAADVFVDPVSSHSCTPFQRDPSALGRQEPPRRFDVDAGCPGAAPPLSSTRRLFSQTP